MYDGTNTCMETTLSNMYDGTNTKYCMKRDGTNTLGYA